MDLKRHPKGWHPSYVKRILENRAVLGEFQPGRKNVETNGKRIADGEVITNLFPDLYRA